MSRKNADYSIKSFLIEKYPQGKGEIKGEYLKLIEMGGIFDNLSEYYLVSSKFIFD